MPRDRFRRAFLPVIVAALALAALAPARPVARAAEPAADPEPEANPVPAPAAPPRPPEGIDPERTSRNLTWGYIRENPIKVGGPRGLSGPASQRLYLDSLRDSNFLAMRHQRLGSVGPGPDGHIVDLYELTGADGRKYRLYLDMYHPEINPLDLPAPREMYFHLRPGARAPASATAAETVRLPRLEEPMAEAERQYRLALALGRELGGRQRLEASRDRYVDYAVASQRYLLGLLDYAETLQAETGRRRAHARGAAAAIERWLADQAERNHEEAPPPVRMWMYFHLGRALVAAGESGRACREGYERAMVVDADAFPAGASRQWAWETRLAAACLRAAALAELARDRAGWERALEAGGGELLSRPEAEGRPVRVRARIVRIRCLRELGRHDEAMAEYLLGRAEIDGLKGPDAADSRELFWELVQTVGPGSVPAADVERQSLPEAVIGVGVSFHLQGRDADAERLLRAAIARLGGESFERRCRPDGEPRAWLYLGMSLLRGGEPVRAGEAFEAALVEFWEKMPASFRQDPLNRRPIELLRRDVLSRCVEMGRAAAEERQRREGGLFDRRLLDQWGGWERRLATGE